MNSLNAKENDMKSFVIKQHDKDRAGIRALRESELKHVGGGETECDVKLNTITVTPRGSKDDGADEG